MIANVHRSQSFRSTVRYVFGKNKEVKVIYGNFTEVLGKDINLDRIITRFANQAAFNHRVQKPVYHVVISASINDKLKDSNWAELANTIINKLELHNNQAFGVLHQDKFFPNSNVRRRKLHLVINAVDHQSKCANFYYDYFRLQNILQDFEEKNILTPTKVV